MAKKPKAPAKLGASGRALWAALVARYEFEPGELAVLALACAQADDIAKLEELLDADGLITTGSTGRPRLSAVVSEVRQQRSALAKLLEQLRLPVDDETVGRSPASRRAQTAALRRHHPREAG